MESIEVNCGEQGRIVIPAKLRKSLGLHPGDRLLVSQRDGKLILEPANLAWQRLKQQVQASAPAESLADELISERRAESELER